MLEELKKDIFISQELRYFDLTNIFFDAPLNYEDISNLKEIFFSINNINQIYFRYDIDLKSIELIKYLLELSPTMEDCGIEKYILDTNNIDLNELCNIKFLNPNSWYVKPKFDDSKVISIDKYKEIENIISNILKEIDNIAYSTFEKVALIYDFCKKLNLENNSNDNVIDILKTKNCNMNGFSKIFKMLLDKIGINSYLGEAIVDNNKSNVVVAYIKDEKYNIDGIYLFDPFSDYISIDDVPNEELRLLNYNYFGILLNDYSKTIFEDRLTGMLNCLVHDYDYDLEKLRFISSKEITLLEQSFGFDFYTLHKKIDDTIQIKDETKLEIISTINNGKLHSVIKENYKKRKNKLLNYEI